VQGVVSDDGGAVRAAPRNVVAEVGVVHLDIRRVDPCLQFGDEVVDGVAGGAQPIGIGGQGRS
jgi:hypothetical protein